LRVLFLNWRDIRHHRAGGAEVLTHEHARRLVRRGHEVTLFTGATAGVPQEETIDGVAIVRHGGPVTTRVHAARWYRAKRRAGVRFDVVVEEINTLPYLASRYARAPTVLWVHQLAREVWWYEAPKLLAPLGFVLERSYLRLDRRSPALVLSESTRRDLVELGFDERSVDVVPPAIDQSDAADRPVEKDRGLLVYVGRLTPSKRVPDLVDALAHIRAGGVDARLALIGRGGTAERDRIRRRAAARNVAAHVEVLGYVDAEQKRDLLARASLVLMASAREGWGLAVTEANALGTPAVVYDRPGLRDSTVHERTGLITDANPPALAAGVLRALGEPGLYEKLQAGAMEWSRRFSWERASHEFEQALLALAAGQAGRQSLVTSKPVA
jgi:glycosyltransferase involved in cell wall biosynthesis